MSSTGLSQNWRKSILNQLEKRKLCECEQFQDLINSHGRLLSAANVHKNRNSEFEIQIYQLRQQVHELQGAKLSGGKDVGGTAVSPMIERGLEQKIYKLQEELTELHRTKGEHAQKIIELTSELKEKDNLLSQKEAQVLNAENNLQALTIETKKLEGVVGELEATNQTIKDEFQALHMLLMSTERKLKDTQIENTQLIQRWMHEKSKYADELNFANEIAESKIQKRRQDQLKDALQEPILPLPDSLSENGNDDLSPVKNMLFITTIPDRPRQTTDCHDGEVTSIQFSPSGKYFVSGGSDRKVKVWEVGRGSFDNIATLPGCGQSIMSCSFDISEKLILAASNDQACRIWSLNEQRLRHTLTGHTGKVLSAKFFSADSSKVVSGSHDRTLKIWDLRSKVCTKTIFAGSSCNDLVTSDVAGTRIISGHFDKKVRFWDITCDQVVNEIQLHGKISSLDLSFDMNYLLASSRDDSLKLIDLRTYQIISTFKNDGFKVPFDYSRACFSPDGQYVMCGTYEGSIFIWNAKTNVLEKVLKEHKNPVIATAWNPNGNMILSCDRNKKVVLWADI